MHRSVLGFIIDQAQLLATVYLFAEFVRLTLKWIVKPSATSASPNSTGRRPLSGVSPLVMWRPQRTAITILASWALGLRQHRFRWVGLGILAGAVIQTAFFIWLFAQWAGGLDGF